ALRSLHEHRLFSEQVSLIHASGRRIIPPPTTLGLPPSLSHPTPQRVGLLTPVSPGFATASQARQLSGRIAFVILRTDRSPPAAPHPASRRRSSSRLQAGEGVPEEDFHLSDQMRFQAHDARFRGHDGREGFKQTAPIVIPGYAGIQDPSKQSANRLGFKLAHYRAFSPRRS